MTRTQILWRKSMFEEVKGRIRSAFSGIKMKLEAWRLHRLEEIEKQIAFNEEQIAACEYNMCANKLPTLEWHADCRAIYELRESIRGLLIEKRWMQRISFA